MKRRSFLGALLGLPAAAAASAAKPEPEPESEIPRGAGYYYKLGVENAKNEPQRTATEEQIRNRIVMRKRIKFVGDLDG